MCKIHRETAQVFTGTVHRSGCSMLRCRVEFPGKGLGGPLSLQACCCLYNDNTCWKLFSLFAFFRKIENLLRISLGWRKLVLAWVFCKHEWCDANFKKPRIPACHGKQHHSKVQGSLKNNIATATLTFVKLHEQDGGSRQSNTGWDVWPLHSKNWILLNAIT